MNAHTVIWSALAMQADFDPAPRSFVFWVITCLSFPGLAMILLDLLLFVGACVVVATSRRSSTIAAYFVLLPLPMLIGILGVLNGIIGAFSVLSLAGEAEIRPSDLAMIFTESAVSIFAGLLAMLPSYLVLAVGLMVREFKSSTGQTE